MNSDEIPPVEPLPVIEWFLRGCSVDCEYGHTLVWGRCALGPEWQGPPLTVHDDGSVS